MANQSGDPIRMEVELGKADYLHSITGLASGRLNAGPPMDLTPPWH
jgi:hypothetical protein